VEFLREPGIEELQLKFMALEMENGPRTLETITTLNGEIDVIASKKAKTFCDGLTPFTIQHREMSNFISGKCKSI